MTLDPELPSFGLKGEIITRRFSFSPRFWTSKKKKKTQQTLLGEATPTSGEILNYRYYGFYGISAKTFFFLTTKFIHAVLNVE